MNSRHLTAVAILSIVGLCPATAQESGFQRGSNPFQQEYTYRVGDDLRPAVQIEGLNWYLINVSPRDPDDLRPGSPVTTIIRLGFSNPSSQALSAVAVILFEDEHGNGLDRIEINDIRVPAGADKEFREKEKLQSDLLLATRKLYVFCEVQS